MNDIQPGSDYTAMGNNKYLRYAIILSNQPYSSKPNQINTKFGIYLSNYTECFMHKKDQQYYNQPPLKYTNNKLSCLCDKMCHFDNWKYYVYNNKLPMFLGISLNYDMHNNVLKYTPYLTDKKYTDEEIYQKLNLTDEEINLIDKTLTKFEYKNIFFKNLKIGK